PMLFSRRSSILGSRWFSRRSLTAATVKDRWLNALDVVSLEKRQSLFRIKRDLSPFRTIMNKAIRSIVLLFVCLSTALTTFAQQEEKFDFYARGDYRPNVPRPQSILRYDVGDFHTTYAQMEQVMNAIAAAAPDRMKIYDIGETNEHRM